MPDTDIPSLTRGPISSQLQKNRKTLETVFRLPVNSDCKIRPFSAGERNAFLCYIDGISSSTQIDDFILRAAKQTGKLPGKGDIAEPFARDALCVSEYEIETEIKDAVDAILIGKCVIFIDGCESVVAIDTRQYEKRSISRAYTENVVLGPQEGFTENLRTNISLLRQTLQTSALVSESLSVGTEIPTRFVLLYIDGKVNAGALNEIRRRIKAVDAPFVSGTGYLQQWIEDHPMALFPQMLQTERPDRAGSALAGGQIVILSDNSPFALVAPVTVFHLLHASDDSFMRWQYGSFIRVIRFIGILVSLYLPAVYISISLYHTHIMPTSLLTSIAETRAKVPFPVFVEVLIMEISFLLINEAGTRIPTQMGSALGIVGALILGQAAVSASIISPIMIIIVALTGLGHYVVPSYSMGLGIQILRLCMLVCAGILGMYGIILFSGVCFACLCGMCSFGVTYFSPAAPEKPHNPDLLLRMPIYKGKQKTGPRKEGGN